MQPQGPNPYLQSSNASQIKAASQARATAPPQPQQEQQQPQQQQKRPQQQQQQLPVVRGQQDQLPMESRDSQTSKALSILLLIVTACLFVYFYLITNTTEETSPKLNFAAELNEYIWYYSIFGQAYYLSLVWGSAKWNCLAFSRDLPRVFRGINLVTLSAGLVGLIWLQIAINFNEKTDSLANFVQFYLSAGYFVVFSFFVYLVYQQTKISDYPSNNAEQSRLYQHQQSQQSITAEDGQSYQYNNYSTFANQN